MDDDMLAQALKSALRNLVRSVVVVTAQHEGRPYAMAATAVSEVSMDPPSMLVCINRDAAIFQAIDAGCAAVRVNPGNIRKFDAQVGAIAAAFQRPLKSSRV